jgi:hypothetical protein
MLTFIFHFLLFFFGTTRLFDFQEFLCKNNWIRPKLWSIHGDINNFNIALPDSYALYKGSFICINKGESITIEGNIPNARYYSMQVYDSSTASLGSLNDQQINIRTDGSFSINITKDKYGVNNKTSSNSLYVQSKNSFLVVIYRLYDYSEISKIILPNIKKANVTIPHVKAHTKIYFPRMYRNVNPVRAYRFANKDNNFFKPTTNAFFSNDDASYLVSLIKVNYIERLGAIITGYLPLTDSSSNINNDYFKTNGKYGKYYEVRYLSFNMGTTSFPFPTIGGNMLHPQTKKINGTIISSSGTPGIIDTDIIKRYSNVSNWNDMNREYTIYVGIDLNHIRELGGNPESDLYLLYPTSYENKLFTYVSILHRHLMPHVKFMENPIFTQSIGDIPNNVPVIPKNCEKVMGKYYPKITFVNTLKMSCIN